MNGLGPRTTRHIEGRGVKRWHIDYLTSVAEEREALLVPSEKNIECSLARRLRSLSGVSEPIPGFGSSDCRCRSHLFLIDERAYVQLKGNASPSPLPCSWVLSSAW